MSVQSRFNIKGLTLVEMLIVVVIIGVLSAIVIPSFSGYMEQTRRSEGRGLLLEVIQKQHRFFVENSTYTRDFRDLGYDHSSWISSANDYYRVGSADCDGLAVFRCVQILAFPKGSTEAEFSINTNGEKKPNNLWP